MQFNVRNILSETSSSDCRPFVRLLQGLDYFKWSGGDLAVKHQTSSSGTHSISNSQSPMDSTAIIGCNCSHFYALWEFQQATTMNTRPISVELNGVDAFPWILVLLSSAASKTVVDLASKIQNICNTGLPNQCGWASQPKACGFLIPCGRKVIQIVAPALSQSKPLEMKFEPIMTSCASFKREIGPLYLRIWNCLQRKLLWVLPKCSKDCSRAWSVSCYSI